MTVILIKPPLRGCSFQIIPASSMQLLEALQALTVTTVTVGILLVNPLTLIGMKRSSSLSKEALTPIIYSIFVGDLIQGLFLGPISSYLSWAGNRVPPLWLVRVHSFYLVGTAANHSGVALLSLWQTIGIVKPLRFVSLATKQKIVTSVAVSWVWAALLTVLIVSSNEIFYDAVNRYAGYISICHKLLLVNCLCKQ